MYSFKIKTLVDITNNGNLKQDFPFKTKSGEIIHDKHSLNIAKNQNNNFDTLLQLLQLRANIVWSDVPARSEVILTQEKLFGSHYEGKSNLWTFKWEVEQPEIYNDKDVMCGGLIIDFDYVPIINFCKESTTFPANAFITQDNKFKNTVFTFCGLQTK